MVVINSKYEETSIILNKALSNFFPEIVLRGFWPLLRCGICFFLIHGASLMKSSHCIYNIQTLRYNFHPTFNVIYGRCSNTKFTVMCHWFSGNVIVAEIYLIFEEIVILWKFDFFLRFSGK